MDNEEAAIKAKCTQICKPQHLASDKCYCLDADGEYKLRDILN